MIHYLIASSLIILSLVLGIGNYALAQPTKLGEITAAPICAFLVNESGRTVSGSISTDRQMTNSGDMASFKENFSLKDGDKKEICSTGPFFEGQRLELTFGSLIPLFSCRTRIDTDIIIRSIEENGVNNLWASCS
ncbi:MAG: hypothetical protein DI626_04630 [Micavibrio aeruginosavorus]|uniref:Uncharacterized protein n=1 Tax=Micavibrio aeruginosavorus TaxID=349221 RepID=A0A2W4ZXW2_9BACT|nr:MAG: hypothetical protein DI626_04630 [Micavibrio aeruginosavorus]